MLSILPWLMMLGLAAELQAKPTIYASEDIPFPNDPQWPSATMQVSRSHEMVTEEDLFAYTQLIFQSVFRQPLKDYSAISNLLSEWSQLCLVKVESPTKTALSFNSGFGYRIKHYEFHLPFDYFYWHTARASFLMPMSLKANVQYKNWTFSSLFNMEFEFDQHTITRQISVGQKFAEYNHRYGDLKLALQAEHVQTLSHHTSYRSAPHLNFFFVVSADIY